MARYISDAPREELDPIINAAKETFDEDLRLDQKIDFKAKAKGFVRAYQFLNMILPVRNVYWQSLAQFLRLLIPKLELPAEEDLSGLFASIDMESYRAEREAIVAIRLEGGGEIDPTPVEVRAGQKEALRTVLSLILAEFNQKFGTNWKDSDKVMRFLFEDLPDEVAKDQEYQNAKRHSDRQNAKITHEKTVVDKFQESIFEHTEAYRKFTDDPDFKKWLCDTLFRMDYERGSGVERTEGA
jgi:type I restriction enzyme R subunit